VLWQQAKTFVCRYQQANRQKFHAWLCLSQTTFIQATKNLHQTLCLLKTIPCRIWLSGHFLEEAIF
jgi:hypothetical protein